MIGGKRVVGIVPARGGSVGIPRKNVKLFGGKPLIAWSIEVARQSRHLDCVIVSTDDEEIARVARGYGADTPFMRPPDLATDTATAIDVVLHALDRIPDADAITLLQPTSPLRSPEDVDGAIEAWHSAGSTVVGVTRARKSPNLLYRIEGGALVPLLDSAAPGANRQQWPPAYLLNGAIYVADRKDLVRDRSFLTPSTRAYVMPPERSVDIDDELDWRYAEYLLRPQ